MSFSFSQNLLSDISSSQSSQSDSLPSTQPMIMNNMSTRSSRQNFTFPRPPSCPDLTGPVSSSNNLRAKDSRQENSSGKTGLGQTLREVQARIGSVPSSFSRMLEEALLFLETEMTKEGDMTRERVKSVRNLLDQVAEDLIENKSVGEEICKKTNSSVENNIRTVNTIAKAMLIVEAGQEDTLRVVEMVEAKLDQQLQFSRDLLEDVHKLKEKHLKNQTDLVREAVKEELERMRSSRAEKSETGGPRETVEHLGVAAAPVTVVRSTVRCFSMASGKEEEIQKVVDFSTVMEVDEEEDLWGDWEE